jgi:anti-sigma B factor antagonist
MSDTSKPPVIQVEQTDSALIARPQMKMMHDEAVKSLARSVDEASDAGGAPIPLVVLDLSRVAIVPSIALGALVQMANKCRARQQKLSLVALQPQIRQVFTITRLDRVFQFFDSVDDATRR